MKQNSVQVLVGLVLAQTTSDGTTLIAPYSKIYDLHIKLGPVVVV
tara:strand:+ start:67 stop:201 length:135 start_codon:yes stop_codon:yes gene_type:complete